MAQASYLTFFHKDSKAFKHRVGLTQLTLNKEGFKFLEKKAQKVSE